MKHSWITMTVTALLIGLLTFFAGSQYFLLSQNSDSEKEKMQRRIDNDTARMADDINREVQSLLFVMLGYTDLRKEVEMESFALRLDAWKERSTLPELIGDIFYLPLNESTSIYKYSADSKRFILEPNANDLAIELKAQLANSDQVSKFSSENFYLNTKLLNSETVIEKIEFDGNTEGESNFTKSLLRHSSGDLVIKLNKDKLIDSILPGLVQLYFPENDFRVAVISKDNETFYSFGGDVSNSDSEAAFLQMSPESFAFVTANTIPGSPINVRQVKGTRVLKTAISTGVSNTENLVSSQIKEIKDEGLNGQGGIEFRATGQSNPNTKIFVAQADKLESYWSLKTQHVAGSVNDYINNEMYKSLLIGITIYLILIVSILAIVFSSIRAQRFAQRKVDFVSSVSHEFRTPLAVIYSAGENLADGIAKSPEQVGKYGNLVRNEGKKLSRMVEQILEFAGAGNGKRKFNFSLTSVENVIDDAVNECLPMLNEKGVHLTTEFKPDVPAINADFEALSGAIQNLIGNAVKYSNDDKSIKITAEKINGKAVISVADKGIGIKSGDIKHIFSPFYRAKEVVDAQLHGNGLGLALVKDVVNAHNGKVTVDSKHGKGSTFKIELPI